MERSCEPMDKNRIEGVARQGERARNREALVIKAGRRRSGGCAAKECVLTRGDLALRLKGRRPVPEREVSRGRSSGSTRPIRLEGDREGPNESQSLRTCKAARPCVRCWGNPGGWAWRTVKPGAIPSATKLEVRCMSTQTRGWKGPRRGTGGSLRAGP